MENKIVDVAHGEITTEYQEALKLHQEIMANGAIAAQALYEMCRSLKRMRDEKLYTSLGYEDFETYCEEKANIRKRQAHNYITAYEKLGKEFLQSNAQLGITKLELLTHVPALDRSDFMNNNDVSELSVPELKKRIKELEQENSMKGEQISMLQEQVSETQDGDNSEEIENLKAEIERLKSEPANAMADNAKKEIAKVKKELKAKAKEEQDKAIREAVDKERKANAKEKEKAVKDATAELKNQVEGYKKKLEAQQENMSEAVRKASELEEKLKSARTDNSLKFRLLFEQVQDSLDNILDVLEDVEDKKEQQTFAERLVELNENIIEIAKEYCNNI